MPQKRPQKRLSWRRWTCLSVLVAARLASGQDDPVMRAMKDELARSMKQLQFEQTDKPYFLAYRVEDAIRGQISASLGSLTSSSGNPFPIRTLGVEIRVGDYALDNSNYFSMERMRPGFEGMLGGIAPGPIDDDYAQIRRGLWVATDRQYKRALEDLSAKKAALKMRTGGETIDDFSREPVVNLAGPRLKVPFPASDLESVARELSAVFRSSPVIDRSSVTIHYRNAYTRYVNSEGTSFTRSAPLLKVEVSAETHAADGLPISDAVRVFGLSMEDLPSKTALLDRVRQMSGLLEGLRSASYLENYRGPVLFEASAAAEVFLHQLGPRLAASRPPTSDSPQFSMFFNQMFDRLMGASFQDKLGARILPQFISVRDDPTQTAFEHFKLIGASPVDDDGVKTRTTALVEHGILETLLNTRTPVRGILHSTGSRHSWGATPSNLFVKSEKTLPDAELRKELLRRARERGLDYGILVRRVGAGSEAAFAQMVEEMTQAKSDSVSEVFKVYADGHEEPLRGVHITELPADSFKDIVATGDTSSVYSDEMIPRLGVLFSAGIGAGGELPVVSCVSPALLFEELGLVKNEGPFPAPAVLPSPLQEQ